LSLAIGAGLVAIALVLLRPKPSVGILAEEPAAAAKPI
jgi:hypothetical protein